MGGGVMSRPPITRASPYTPRSGPRAGITFTSERQYRNALAREKGYRSHYERERAAKPVRRAHDLDTLRQSEQGARGRALEAVRFMRREGRNLKDAAKAAGTTPNAVHRHAGPALEKVGGTFRVKPYDRLARPMAFYTDAGHITLDVRDSRSAAAIGRYMNAVRRYLETGDARPLRKFWGKSVTVDKCAYRFITDTNELDALAGAGELRFDSIYALAS